jgi:hypothetical protein
MKMQHYQSSGGEGVGPVDLLMVRCHVGTVAALELLYNLIGSRSIFLVFVGGTGAG